MSKYEYTKILGQRVAQLNQGYTSYITRMGILTINLLLKKKLEENFFQLLLEDHYGQEQEY